MTNDSLIEKILTESFADLDGQRIVRVLDVNRLFLQHQAETLARLEAAFFLEMADGFQLTDNRMFNNGLRKAIAIVRGGE